ncbi:uncharacterized protein B0P05DRAFT_585338 [Gilbertella persicaria]|uniref:uncharacterized protein n=1 Tax=Gilbertella persicaria TaxID=101096 RepID=UPI00221FD504|nr:uncharacterized protein B0P05DRAFT_585338 [Gilbertella persicaria]KAI8085821.1 hypothetical protein B0P05DRAFT_585338 [Gilbertella persicaria]
MSLSVFLADDTTGGSSWADDVADLPSAPAAREERSDAYASRDRGDRNYGGDRQERGGFERRERGGFDRPERSERGGFERRERGGFDRPERAPRAPAELPTRPPFTAHVANLAFESTEDDLGELFNNLNISNIRLVRDRESDRSKGFGYVEFDDLDSLKGALELSGENVHGRSIRVNIAEPPRENDRPPRAADRTDVDTWRRTGPIELPEAPRREFRDSGRGGFGGRGRGDSWGRNGGGFGSRDRPSERPRLNLKPRTVDSPAANASKSASSKPDPFGGAKPVDTDKALKKFEGDEPKKEA